MQSFELLANNRAHSAIFFVYMIVYKKNVVSLQIENEKNVKFVNRADYIVTGLSDAVDLAYEDKV